MRSAPQVRFQPSEARPGFTDADSVVLVSPSLAVATVPDPPSDTVIDVEVTLGNDTKTFNSAVTVRPVQQQQQMRAP